MGLTISSDLRNAPTDNAESITPPPNMTTDAAGSNQVNEHDSAPQPGHSNPTDSAREATPPKPPTVDQQVNERLAADPDYQELQAKLEALKQFEKDFALIDAGTLFGRFNNVITLTEVKDVAADWTQPAATREAAQRLLSNVALWNELASGVRNDNDNVIGANDVGRLIGATKEAMTGMRKAVHEEILAEQEPKTGAQTGGTPNSTTPGATGGSSAAANTPKLPPSTLPGVDGALENLSNAAQSIQDQMLALANEATEHPEKATAIGQKIAMLNNQLQAITNMMNQLTQMISNMSKMWSDVSMNSIRNLR